MVTANFNLLCAARMLMLCSCCLGRGRQTKIRELEERLHDQTELLETRQAELEQLEVIWRPMCTRTTCPIEQAQLTIDCCMCCK